MALKIRIALCLTLKIKKNERPRILFYTQIWIWGQTYSFLNSVKLSWKSEVTLLNRYACLVKSLKLRSSNPWTSFTTGQGSGVTVSIQADIMGAVTWDPNYTPGMDFLDHIFSILKNSGQDLSNEGSNFILSSLEVGHWVAQT